MDKLALSLLGDKIELSYTVQHRIRRLELGHDIVNISFVVRPLHERTDFILAVRGGTQWCQC